MRKMSKLLLLGLLTLAGCGDNGETSAPSAPRPTSEAAGEETGKQHQKRRQNEAPVQRKTIKVGDSEFGSMLFDSNEQAIYIFENDSQDSSVCYGECAEAWPPVLSEGKPKGSGAARDSLLGTIERPDGKRQATYAGKPLYFYAHEEPGEVRCHNVDLNGGLWWVIGPNGKRRP